MFDLVPEGHKRWLEQMLFERRMREDEGYRLLRNDAARAPELRPAEGILLYPRNGLELDGQYHVHGHDVRLATVDLALPWQQIDARLRALIGMSSPARAP
jgi:5-methylcytosine-specific restriction enzyme subunit McrC